MKRFLPGPRRGFLLLLVLCGLVSSWLIDLHPRYLNPGEGGIRLAQRFFLGAITPTITSGGQSSLLTAIIETIKIALAATGLSIVLGLIMSYFCRESVPGYVRRPTRVFMSVLRSVHELLWATLFLAAFGMSPIAAVIALAIPYSGTFGKLYAEMIDEADVGAAHALQASGAGSIQVFLFAHLPMAFADLVSYTLYRFECAIRSSAVMGFMGVTTLGYYISTAYENALYREVWGYLYVLIILVFCFEKWSDSIRHRLQVGAMA